MTPRYVFFFFLVCLYVFQDGQSRSLADIGERIGQIAGKVKCKIHKVGNKIVEHEHQKDPCHSGKEEYDPSKQPNVHIEPPSNHIDASNDIKKIDHQKDPDIDVRSFKDVPEGTTPKLEVVARRLIYAGSNCPPGSVADQKGVCREEYD